MKILIIGNRWHQFITNYVEALRSALNNEVKIDILSYDYINKKYPTDELYNQIYDLHFPLASVFPKYLRIFIQHIILRYRLKRIGRNYDIIHIHYVENYLLRDASYLIKTIKSRLMITLWGADSRAQGKQFWQLERWLTRANGITMATEEMIECFYEKHGKNFSNKVFQCKFGMRPLDWIEKKWGEDIFRQRSLLGLPKDKIVIAIGHNARKEQRHCDIIDTLDQNTELRKYLEKLCFVLMLTYPKDSDYIAKVKNRAAESPFYYSIEESFLSEEEVANYRMTSDVYIQLQREDVLSGSMLEYLSCNCIVVTGSWLPYQMLDRMGVLYNTVDSITEAPIKLAHIVENFEHYKHTVEKNHILMLNAFKWNNVINDWIKAYGIISQN